MQIRKVAQARLPLPQGEFQAVGYISTVTNRELIALVYGDIGDGKDVLVRVHSECLTGTFSARCAATADRNCMRRCMRWPSRVAAWCCTSAVTRAAGSACWTSSAPTNCRIRARTPWMRTSQLGLPNDAREYGTGAQVLADLGIKSMRLLTNNPAKRAGLEGYGLTISGRVALPVSANPENMRYLTTKRDRMGHELDGLDALYGEGHA